jgi:Protein of unknown function (DUF742)
VTEGGPPVDGRPVDGRTVDGRPADEGSADHRVVDGGRVVPAYALTRGRTRSEGQDLPLETMATVTALGRERQPSMQIERRAILDQCLRPTSVVEVAALLRVPVGVARVLVGDLASGGYLAVHLPPPADDRPDPALLERLLEGLRAR